MKIIVGGGISGLWLAAELKARGMHCCVIDRGPLGQGQTLASQGMIHGGTKYALDGLLSRSAQVIGAMPGRWRAALKGEGTVDLSEVSLERADQLLWSTDSIASNLVGFFASQAMRSRMQRIDPDEEPAFKSREFAGHLYRLSEPVLKLDTLISAFQNRLGESLYQAEVKSLIQRDGNIQGVETDQGTLSGEVILTAGEGNEALLASAGIEHIKMQRRPLAMGVVKLNTPIPPVFGHQLGATSKPKLTISTHHIEGSQYLYLGGQVAEDGIDRSDELQKTSLVDALHAGLHWLKPDIATTEVFRINRAEPSMQGHRPETAFVQHVAGCWVCWPTKLALAPALSDALITKLKDAGTFQYPTWSPAKRGTYPWLSH